MERMGIFDNMEYFLVTIIAFITLWGSHEITQKVTRLIGRPELPRLATYTIGIVLVGIILTVFALILPGRSAGDTVIAFWCIVAGAGAGTCAGWGLDWVTTVKRIAQVETARADDGQELANAILDQRETENV